MMEYLEARFNQLFNAYEEKTIFLSYHATGLYEYAEIVKMGKSIISFLLKRIKDSWLCSIALAEITKECPFDPIIPKEDYAGHFDEITDAWLQWGKKNKYIK